MPQSNVRQTSTDSTPFSVDSLTSAQATVVRALLQGRSISAAAGEAGVHRSTVHNWLHNSDDFRSAVNQARAEFAAALADQIRDLSGSALATVRALIEDSSAPPAVRLKAALAVLERPRFPEAGWQLPERIESPREQAVIDGIAEMEADLRRLRLSGALDDSSGE